MKPGDIVMWLSVGPEQRHKAHLKRFAELVSSDDRSKQVSLKVVEDGREQVFRSIPRDQIETLSPIEEAEYQYLKANGVEARGAVSEYVPKDYRVYQGLSEHVHKLLDKIENSGKKVMRVDLFGEDLHVQLDDESIIKEKVINPLDNVYALRKWFNIKNQSQEKPV